MKKRKKNCNRKSERRNKKQIRRKTERSRNRITKIKQIKVKKGIEMQ